MAEGISRMNLMVDSALASPRLEQGPVTGVPGGGGIQVNLWHRFLYHASRVTGQTLGAQAANALVTPDVYEATGTTAPALTSPWTNYGSVWEPVRYWKAGERVYLMGLVRGGNNGTDIFTLPVGLRPAKRCVFFVAAHSGASEIAGRIDVLATGQVRNQSNVNIPAGGYLSLAGVHFRADQ